MDEPGGAAPTRREVVGGTLAAAALATWPPVARAADGPREVPARILPVPTTVSPELQAVIARPLPPGWDQVPADAAA